MRFLALLLVPVAVVTAAATGCGGGDPLLSPTTMRSGADGAAVEGDGYEGVVLDAGLDWLQRPDGTLVEDVTSFVPTEADVERFETALRDEPTGEPTDERTDEPTGEPTDLSDYVRQYTGVAATDGSGDRHLVVAGICASAAGPGGSLSDWRDGWIEVADGGDCFWDATMDLTSGDILRFGFHGSA